MSRNCAVVFVVGGQSSRMGQPKAWLTFEGKPLLAHLVARMRPWASEVVIVGAAGQELPETGARVLCDEHPGEGPLAGLVVGLREIRAPFALAVSCDLPFLDPRIATHLLAQAEGHEIVVPEWNGCLQPLHAIYRRTVQPIIAEQLSAGRRRVLDLFGRADTLVISEAELRAIDSDGRSFRNVNTPEDYRAAVALWRALRIGQNL